MAAIRCSSVDLPEPDGPISATNSPFSICDVDVLQRDHVELVADEFFGQTARFDDGFAHRNSCFLAHAVAILQRGGRIDDQILAADQSLLDAHALAVGGARSSRGGATARPSSTTKTLLSRMARSRHDHDRASRRRGGARSSRRRGTPRWRSFPGRR